MRIIADTHTHTIACDHAFSTIGENAAAAAKQGMRFLCMTEHGTAMKGAPSQLYFGAQHTIVPPAIHGVAILKGVELNIMNEEGELDLPDTLLERMDWVIASMHVVTYRPAGRENHTRAWLRIAENPLVDVIGHCGDGRFPFDEDIVLPAFKAYGKIVEINNHSFVEREGSEENCRRIAIRCGELGIPVVVSSDSHFHQSIGKFPNALKLLESIGFPEELILNGDYDRFLAVAREKAGPRMKRYLETM